MKDCGSCRHWHKCKPKGYGICEKYDIRCNSDDGKSCEGFERPEYNRAKHGPTTEPLDRELDRHLSDNLWSLYSRD